MNSKLTCNLHLRIRKLGIKVIIESVDDDKNVDVTSHYNVPSFSQFLT